MVYIRLMDQPMTDKDSKELYGSIDGARPLCL